MVDAGALRAVGAIDGATLRRYADAVERGPESRPVVEALGTDAMRVRVRIAPGELLVMQQSYDPAWTCWSGARRVATAKDPIGFLLVDPGPGDHDLLLRFETPLENRAGAAAGLVAVAVIALLGWRARRSAINAV